jgi:uncharacterized membrane protein YdjX (TVP38/TMEM64 family)
VQLNSLPSEKEPSTAKEPFRRKTTNGSGKRSSRRRLWFWGGIVAVVAACGAYFLLHSGIDLSEVRERLMAMNPVATLAALAALPLVGFSVVIVYLVIGAKFGLWIGGLVITGLTAFHLVVSHWIARTLLGRPLRRLLQKYQDKVAELPPGDGPAIAATMALIPGIPYFARNYMLGLSGIALKRYFWVCLPIYVIRSYVTLSLGDMADGVDRQKLIVLAIIYVVKLAICALLLRRISQHLKQKRDPRPKETRA